MPIQMAVEMNTQSLLQYKQLAGLQEAMAQMERDKVVIELELNIAG